jgi:hypothetical protein
MFIYFDLIEFLGETQHDRPSSFRHSAYRCPLTVAVSERPSSSRQCAIMKWIEFTHSHHTIGLLYFIKKYETAHNKILKLRKIIRQLYDLENLGLFFRTGAPNFWRRPCQYLRARYFKSRFQYFEQHQNH